MNIVDIHIHPNYSESHKGARYMADLMAGYMDKSGVAISGILGRVPPFQNMHDVSAGNSFTIDTVAAQPDRLFGMCFVNPAHPQSFVEEEMDRVLSAPGIRGVKLEIDVNARDVRIDLVMEKARQYKVPVLHHCWYMSFWNSPPEREYYQHGRSEPHDIADLARRHPDVPIIMAHLDGCGIRGVLDVLSCKNVFIDTSGGQPFTGVLEYATRVLGPDRLLYGSDLMGRGAAAQLARVYGAAISESDKRKILSENAIELFKLESMLAVA